METQDKVVVEFCMDFELPIERLLITDQQKIEGLASEMPEWMARLFAIYGNPKIWADSTPDRCQNESQRRLTLVEFEN